MPDPWGNAQQCRLAALPPPPLAAAAFRRGSSGLRDATSWLLRTRMTNWESPGNAPTVAIGVDVPDFVIPEGGSSGARPDCP